MNKTAAVQQPTTPRFTPPAKALLQRRCSCGNQAIADGECAECAKKKSSLQRKLAIGASDDPLELEADRVADQVMAAPTHSEVGGAPPHIQRYAGQAVDSADTAPSSVGSVLADPGSPLEPALRQDMEQRFVHDFSRVRVHTGQAAEQSAREVSAQAYTVGSNIVFAAGRFAPGTNEGRHLLAHELAHVVQQSGADGLNVGQRDEQRASLPAPISPTPLQRQAEAVPSAEEAGLEAEAEPEASASGGFLVEDDASEVGPAQMRKSEFLAQLRAEVCAAANAELAAVGRSTDGCPYLNYWFNYYSARDSQQVERALRRYAPDTAGATSARDYIPIIVERVRQAVAIWARTGEVTGVPEQLPEGGPSITPETVGLSGDQASAEAPGVQFKGREGGPRAANLQTIHSSLRQGAPLDSTTRGRMEHAFGHDFSHVRVHTDAAAAGLSSGLNARAFTVGGDVAFGAGEYRPGTLWGDALIAHELAHVVQQSGAPQDVAPLEIGGSHSNAMEDDADRSAVGVVAALWGGAKGMFKEMAKNAMPRLRSGLGLRRCSCDKAEETIRYRLIATSGFPDAPLHCRYCACTKAVGGAQDLQGGPRGTEGCPPGREIRWKCTSQLSSIPLSTEPCQQSHPDAQCR